MRKFLLLLLPAALLLLPPAVRAQQQSPTPAAPSSSTETPIARGIANVSFALGFPQRAFRSHVDNLGYGVHLFIGAAFTQVPVAVGLDGSFLVYGHESRDARFTTLTTNNNIADGYATVRLQPSLGRVRPYLGGLIGLKYLYTRTQLEDDTAPNDEPIDSTVNLDDFAFSYGAAAGLDVVVYRDAESGAELSVNLGARYLFGGEADYFKEGSIERGGDRVDYELEHSRTDLLIPQLGVSVTF